MATASQLLVSDPWPEDIDDVDGQDANSTLIWHLLCRCLRHTNPKKGIVCDGIVFPSLQWLAQKSRMSGRTVNRALKKLEEAGMICRPHRTGGRGLAVEYHLHVAGACSLKFDAKMGSKISCPTKHRETFRPSSTLSETRTQSMVLCDINRDKRRVAYKEELLRELLQQPQSESARSALPSENTPTATPKRPVVPDRYRLLKEAIKPYNQGWAVDDSGAAMIIGLAKLAQTDLLPEHIAEIAATTLQDYRDKHNGEDVKSPVGYLTARPNKGERATITDRVKKWISECRHGVRVPISTCAASAIDPPPVPGPPIPETTIPTPDNDLRRQVARSKLSDQIALVSDAAVIDALIDAQVRDDIARSVAISHQQQKAENPPRKPPMSEFLVSQIEPPVPVFRRGLVGIGSTGSGANL